MGDALTMGTSAQKPYFHIFTVLFHLSTNNVLQCIYITKQMYFFSLKVINISTSNIVFNSMLLLMTQKMTKRV